MIQTIPPAARYHAGLGWLSTRWPGTLLPAVSAGSIPGALSIDQDSPSYPRGSRRGSPCNAKADIAVSGCYQRQPPRTQT
jgi:hypothetical protein